MNDDLPEIPDIKDYLAARMGPRSKNPNALTNAERQRRWRAKNGGRGINFYLHPEAAISLLYLQKQWGFKTYQETLEASLRHLAIETRKGLKKLVLTID